jgi:O-acetyl-ADP-ribose deacetylase (regulator of RNase III)
MDEELMAIGPEDRHTDMRVGLTIISLREGDLTEADVDAIVNAANPQLQLGAGVAGAIRERGGPTIQEECNRIGTLKTGQAVMTGGGTLRARHVIHAVGPRKGEGDEERVLAETTRSALQVATAKGLASLALPAISTGVYGVDKATCARAMLGEVTRFLEAEKTTLRRIEFCLRGTESMQAFMAEMHRLRDQIEAKR